MNLTIYVSERHRLYVHYIQSCFAGIGKELNVLESRCIKAFVPDYLAYGTAIGIDRMVLVTPVPFVRAYIANINARIAPMDHNPCRIVFNHTREAVANLLICHVLRTAVFGKNLGTLIRHPAVVIGDPISSVIGATPVDHAGRISIELDYNIREIGDTPHVIPKLVKL